DCPETTAAEVILVPPSRMCMGESVSLWRRWAAASWPRGNSVSARRLRCPLLLPFRFGRLERPAPFLNELARFRDGGDLSGSLSNPLLEQVRIGRHRAGGCHVGHPQGVLPPADADDEEGSVPHQ